MSTHFPRAKRNYSASKSRRGLLLEPLETRRLLATFSVDTLRDEFDGNFASATSRYVKRSNWRTQTTEQIRSGFSRD